MIVTRAADLTAMALSADSRRVRLLNSWSRPDSVSAVVADLQCFRASTEIRYLTAWSKHKAEAQLIVVDSEIASRRTLALLSTDELWPRSEAAPRLMQLLEAGATRTNLNAAAAMIRAREMPRALEQALLAAMDLPDGVPTVNVLARLVGSSAVTLRREWRSVVRSGLRLQDLVRAIRLARMGNCCDVSTRDGSCRCLSTVLELMQVDREQPKRPVRVELRQHERVPTEGGGGARV